MLGADAKRSATSPKLAVFYSDLPQSTRHAFIPGNNAPEVCSSNAPEATHGPQDFPPEIAPGTGLETKTEGLAHAGPEKDFPIRNNTKPSKATRLWAGLVVGTIIVAAIIVGAVGGTLGRRRSSNSVSADNSSQVQAFASIVLKNTSLAAASCPNGDRWLFLQDTQGNVRGCSYSVSLAKWTVLPNTAIPTTAKLGSALGASCEDIPASLSSGNLATGTYVSVVYLNASENAINQARFMNGAWEDSGLIQAAESPTSDTKLSVSTSIVPSLKAGNTTETSPAYLSSVVIYQQTDASFVMMNTDPDTQQAIYQEDNPVNSNLFDLLQSQAGPTLSLRDSSMGVGFSCIYNSPSVDGDTEPAPWQRQLYAQCSIAKGADIDSSAIIEETAWGYNQSSPGNGNITVVSTSSNNWSTNANPNVDLVTFPFAQDKIALASLNRNKTVAMEIGSEDMLVSPVAPPPLPATIPFGRIGATSGGGSSSIIYVYYQVNQSHFGEISFDNNDGVWSAQPVFVPVS